jgi:uncharacterized protein (DUF1778 family)
MVKRGRPPLEDAERRDERLELRLNSAEKQAFDAAARLSGLPLSGWIRTRLLALAKKETLRKPRKT